MRFIYDLFLWNIAAVTVVMVVGLGLEYVLSGPFVRRTIYNRAYYKQSLSHWFWNCCMPVLGLAIVLKSFYGILRHKIRGRRVKKHLRGK